MRPNRAYGWPGFANNLKARKNVKREPDRLPFFYPKEQRPASMRLYSCKIIKEIEEKRMSKSIRHALILTVIILILSACNLPSNAPATEEPNAVFTAAAQTVQAQLTQSVPFSTPTLPPAFA